MFVVTSGEGLMPLINRNVKGFKYPKWIPHSKGLFPKGDYSHPESVVSVLCVQNCLFVTQMICLLCRWCSSQWTTCSGCDPDTVFTRTQPACGGFVYIKPTVEWWETVPDSSSHSICSHSTHHISWIPSPTLWMGWCPSAQPYSSGWGLLPGSDHLSIITLDSQIP